MTRRDERLRSEGRQQAFAISLVIVGAVLWTRESIFSVLAILAGIIVAAWPPAMKPRG